MDIIVFQAQDLSKCLVASYYETEEKQTENRSAVAGRALWLEEKSPSFFHISFLFFFFVCPFLTFHRGIYNPTLSLFSQKFPVFFFFPSSLYTIYKDMYSSNKNERFLFIIYFECESIY